MYVHVHNMYIQTYVYIYTSIYIYVYIHAEGQRACFQRCGEPFFQRCGYNGRPQRVFRVSGLGFRVVVVGLLKKSIIATPFKKKVRHT